MKKVLSILLSVVLSLSTLTFVSLSVTADTCGDCEYNMLSDNTVEITGYNKFSRNLKIPLEINDYTATSIGSNAFANDDKLESVTIPLKTKIINDEAFRNSTSLPSIQPTIPYPTEPSTQPIITCPAEPSTQPTIPYPTEPSTQPTIPYPTEPSTQPTITCPTEPSTQPTITCPAEPSTQPTIPYSTEHSIQTTVTYPTGHSTQPATVITAPTTQKPTPQPTVCVHTTVVKDAKPATYFANGYTGDRVCVKCGVVIILGSRISKLVLRAPTISVFMDGNIPNVTYNKVAGATGFQVRYRANEKWDVLSFEAKKSKTIQLPESTSALDIQVRAFVEQGELKAYGAWSKVKRCSPTVSTPTDLETEKPTEHIHSYKKSVAIKETCTESGMAVYKCSCGNEYYERINATGHNYVSKIVRVATCTEKGIMLYECSNCKNQYFKDIAKKSHTVVTDKAISANYFKSGLTQGKHCSVCKTIIVQQRIVAKLILKTPKFKLVKGKKQFKVRYTAVSSATGFQVKYKLKGKWKTVNVNAKKNVTKAIKKLKKGKYQVKIRVFIKQGKEKVYSAWTKVKKVKVK